MPYALRCKLVGILAAGLAFATLGLAASAKTPGKKAPTTQTPALPVTNLYPSGAIDFSAPPAVAVIGGVQCDTNGNIYLQYFPSVQIINHMMRVLHRVVSPPLRRLDVDSREVLKFKAGPFQGYTKSYSNGYYVTPNGDVYNLAQACRSGQGPKGHETCAMLVTKYHHDGSVDSTVKLHVPQGANLAPSKFAAFPDGSLLVAGTSMSQKKGWRPFTAIFDHSGDFLTDVTLPQDVAPAPAPKKVKVNPRGKPLVSGPPTKAMREGMRLSTAVSGTRLVGSPDGTIYLLRAGTPERLYVLSSGGKVLREQTLTLPRKDLAPVNVSVNGQGDLVVYYSHIPTPNKHNGQYFSLALVSPQTGKVITTYTVPRKAGIPACMTSEGVILFTQESKSGHLAVAEYTPE